jgi:hypothetical protein
MKRTQKAVLIVTTLLIVSLISLTRATAQNEKAITRFYLQGAVGGGSFNHYYSDVSLQTVLKNKWSMSLSYQNLEDMRPNNIPSDYIPATGEGFFLFFPYSYTGKVDNVSMKLVSLTGGRYFKLGRNTWATTEAGLSYVKGEKIKFNSVPVSSGSSYYLIGWENYTTSNYEMTVENKNTIGLMAKADVNWAFASFMGIGCGVYGNLNSIQSPVGFNVKLMVGLMGREKRHKR